MEAIASAARATKRERAMAIQLQQATSGAFAAAFAC